MKVYREIDNLYDFNFWSGAEDTIQAVILADKEDEFWDLLEEMFSDRECVSETEINDFVWFERDYIYNRLGLNENGRLIDDDDEDDEDDDLWGDDGLWGDDDLDDEDDYMLGY